MDARFTAEQEEIRRTVRELLLKRCGPEEVRAAVRTGEGYDGGLWAALSDQLGLPGLALPEAYGGVGCSVTELALSVEELGRSLAPSPLLSSSVLVAPLILALGTERQRAELLPPLASGRLTAALAVPGGALPIALALTADNQGAWSGGGRAGGVQARRAGDGWRLYGEAGQVLDGHSAGLLVVAAHAGGYARSRTLLFLVRAGEEDSGGGGGAASGVVRVRLTSLDETRPVARLELRDVRAELLGDDDTADIPAALAGVGEAAAAVLAAEAVGAADRALERTVAYVRQREQFGRPIGSFQAVKHRLADVYVGVRAARSAAYYAAWAAAADSPGTDGRGRRGGERVGGLALAQALEALRVAAGEGIQLHGGIGFTWEHEAQSYFKRAAGDELLFGPVHRLRGRAADAAGVFTGEGGEHEGRERDGRGGGGRAPGGRELDGQGVREEVRG
ncbi:MULTISPECIES: acyl-CoA dehydrogenase family protein [Streptomyces]|uniref:Acyl-CoA/acyl-ACP dehydrogenase n=1 Tax=Streptomyces caniscabiei TaxID=2746961 RepID=A0ABU4MUL5_9ACTN|nr:MULTISPECIES: acyl-CoA dehydrogenase family protein [Streptomyces]MBE4738309.1 acyl-CoA/acyl-ACP dehydrogenase [Streptomyces caniscabiei]MBE4757071.1 acyl-CoA/acyl-ACP dehydrogenase [Streptomyces caniscabiei]MBE4770275.1 acyl-CoA/acyl-ACP dehydrogenase [Streptomyces caniscabiei]MBE4785419.1 acyl-CoA/acyl-ACP dehydrogenase [Streptomyces caniscabiei]MBE4796761.1 acyl-CoA/acyl-ACP dehydrogenase [Streptomyces caniscabiei]